MNTVWLPLLPVGCLNTAPSYFVSLVVISRAHYSVLVVSHDSPSEL